MIIKVDDNGTIKSAVIAQNTSELDNDSGFMSDKTITIELSSTSTMDRIEAIRMRMRADSILSFVGIITFTPSGSLWHVFASFSNTYMDGVMLVPTRGGNSFIKYRCQNNVWTTDTYIPVSKTSDLTNDSGFMSYNYLECTVSSASVTDEERAESLRTTMLSNGILSFVGLAVFRPGGNYWPVIATFRSSDGAGSITRSNWGDNRILKFRYNGSTWANDTFLPSTNSVKSVSFTGTTNTNGAIVGGIGTFGINDGAHILSAYFTRGSFGANRHISVYNYGTAGFGLRFFNSSDDGTPVASQSVSCTIYYV